MRLHDVIQIPWLVSCLFSVDMPCSLEGVVVGFASWNFKKEKKGVWEGRGLERGGKGGWKGREGGWKGGKGGTKS